MNQQERDDLRVHWESFRQHRTHFLDCYKWHPECAVICVLDAWEAEVHDGSYVNANLIAIKDGPRQGGLLNTL